jgi:hypothetical protein
VSAVRFKFRCNILISGKIIKEMPGSVASGTTCIFIIIIINNNLTIEYRDVLIYFIISVTKRGSAALKQNILKH